MDPDASTPTGYIDLSMPIRPGMPVFPGHAHTAVYHTSTHEQMQAFGAPVTFQVEAFHMSTHEGTHVDGPVHATDGGASLDALPLERFAGTAVCIDVGHVAVEELVTRAHLERALDDARLALEPGEHLLLRTGHHERSHGTPRWFRHTGLDADAARWVVGRHAASVGIDAPSIDSSREMKQGAYPAHRVLLREAEVLVVENLVNLDVVAGSRVAYQFLPLPLAATGGAPVRAVAHR